jgi:hypothetical protein
VQSLRPPRCVPRRRSVSQVAEITARGQDIVNGYRRYILRKIRERKRHDAMSLLDFVINVRTAFGRVSIKLSVSDLRWDLETTNY